jgi:FtsP/CotA-like multicopper oxidase with cupredoxin domain
MILVMVAFGWSVHQVLQADASSGESSASEPASATSATSADPVATSADPAAPSAAQGAKAAPAGQKGDKTNGQVTRDKVYVDKFKKVAPSQQKAAAKAAAKRGQKPGLAGAPASAKPAARRGLQPGVAGMAASGLAGAAITAAAAYDPGTPHYFGPYGNWAFSPLPSGPITTVSVIDGGAGYVSPIATFTDAYVTTFTPQPPVTVVPTVDTNGSITGIPGAITGIPVPAGTNGYMAPVVTITDTNCGVAPQPPCGTGALGDAIIGAVTPGGPLTGGIRKFVNTLPQLGPGGANNVIQAHGAGQYLAVAIPEACTYSNQAADCYAIGLVTFSEKMHADLPSTNLRGYVQLETPGLLAQMAAMNPPLVSKHIDVGGGRFAIDNPHYLGPTIVAQGKVAGLGAAGAPKPVRITFYNLLPAGAAGNLLLPVDETVDGAGVGPTGEKFTQNRATIHLHGNNTVWISDGNTHQWITPATENTPYPAGVSARNVPDMGTGCDANPLVPGLPGDATNRKSSGCMTFFYTNAQSARLQFYHDHAHGITRVNVYAGEAAGYVVSDLVESDMINGTNFTGVQINCADTNGSGKAGDFLGECPKVLPDIGIPLIIQDKTFVDETTVYAQDPTWAWGSGPPGTPVRGDFWYPHVYMTVTNPWDPTGTNAYGRWFYGPWFNPPTPVCVNGGPAGCIEVGTVPNPYKSPDCDLVPMGPGCAGEPPVIPGVPNPSIPGESFLDTPIVNGTAYPVLHVSAGPVRFRILNATNDRAQNLQLYKAADKNTWRDAYTDTSLGFPIGIPGSPTAVCAPGANPANCTEVKMVPVSVATPNQYADTPSGIPDPTTKGPSWIQIGTEGGFTPAPVVIPQQPIGYNLDPAYFNFGIVNQHSLFLMSAERSDVIVDFSAFAGQTLILYNDAPAPVPAGAAPYDFFTGDGNLMDSGGAPNTQPGYGPNTRTIMQIVVDLPANPANATVTLANLRAVFAKTAAKRGVFEVSQDPIVIPQAAYSSAYNQAFPTQADQFILNIGDTQKTFQPLAYTPANPSATPPTPDAWSLQPSVTIPFEMKAMHDEMGGVYDTGYGRMSGMLGLTNPNSSLGFILPFPYSSPPTDVVKGSLESTKIGELADGTQIWRIFHNGVDTHPIHTHLFTAQVISRVGQDGQVAASANFPSGQAVDAQNVGWKDTFYVNPLEITFLALRPTVPTPSEIPFEVPNSVRLINPTLPEGATLPPPGPSGWFDPNGVQLAGIVNHLVNFGWEYVWHCHILSHEEMDFMHSLVFAVPPKAPTGLAGTALTGPPRVNLTWTDNSSNEVGWRIQKATDANFTIGVTDIPIATPNVTAFQDSNVTLGSTYWYRVFAIGEIVGDVTMPGFPTMAAESVSNTARVQVAGAVASVAPLSLVFGNQLVGTTSPPQTVTLSNTGTAPLTFTVPANVGDFSQSNTCGGVVQPGASCPISVRFTPTAAGARSATLTITTNDPAHPTAVGLTGTGVVAGPVAPSNLTATLLSGPTRIQLSWRDNSNNENLFQVWRSVNGGAFTQIATVTRTNAQRTATGGTVTYTNTGTFTVGSTYAYYVIAVNTVPNPDQSSVPSNTATVTVTGLPAAPTNLRVTGTTRTTISVAWNDNSNNEVDFEIQYRLGGANWSPAAVVPANTTAYTGTWAPNWTIQYRVRARNAAGNSAWSNIVTAATLP